MIGRTILQYEIVEQLGEGGMGIVYKARDTKLDRFVALKFLTKNIGSTDADRQRFLQEAKAAATLNHPNICTVYDVSEFEGQMFIAMEFIDGETLRDRRSNISVKQSIEIGIQVAEALAAAHEKGIIHRDIKPENVMLRKDGLVQIMDFGLAKQQGASRLTREGNTVGTIGYMSPEQVQGFNVDHRSDIFSFGVMLYELLSGQSPFKGMHETAIIYEIVNVDPEPVSIIKPDLPPDLDAILLECLAKDADERYQSAKEIVKDLRKLKRESSRQTASRILAVRKSQISSGSRLAPMTTEFETVPQQKAFRFNVWMAASVMSALIIVAMAGYYFTVLRTAPELFRLSFETADGTIFNSTNGGHIALSPDGTMIVYVATDSLGKDHLWVRSLSSPTPILLSGTDNAIYPFWSNDSRMIGYFADQKLKKIDAKGGPSFTICDASSGRGGTWNANGIIVFSPVSNGPLHQVAAAGGVSKPVTTLDSLELEANNRWPFFLPDNEHFLYTAQTTKASLDEDAEQIRIGSLSGGNGPVLIRATSNAVYDNGYILYYKQNSVLMQPFDVGSLTLAGDPAPIVENVLYSRPRSKGAFSVSQNGRMLYLGTSKTSNEMAIFTMDGVVQSRIKINSPPTVATFSPDGKFYAVDIYDEAAKNTDLWIHDIVRNSDTRLTFDKRLELVPVWSQDASKIYFSSNKSGVFNIFEKNSNGTGEESLVYESKSPSYATDISQDGTKLLLSVQTQGIQKWDIGIFDLTTKKYLPLLTSEFNEWVGTFSPDGKWYTYMSNETGRFEIYIRPTDGSPSKWQVSTNGGENPRWCSNGKEILYHIGNQQIVSTAVNVSGDQIEVGTSTQMFKIDPGFQNRVSDISIDGKMVLTSRALNTQLLKNGSVIMNWQNLVERK